MNKRLLWRCGILLALLACVLGVFAVRLMRLQIVHGQEYLEQASSTVTVTSSVSAARGEIVDRYGRVIAGNRVGYAVSLNRLYLPDKNLNQTLLRLTEILSQAGEEWADSLPLSQQAPWTYTGDEAAVERLRNTLEVSSVATAENAWVQLLRRYDLEEGFDAADQRTLAGIRYEMELREYSNVTPFTLATDVSMRTVTAIRERTQELVGVEILEESVRYYPDGTLIPHLLGTVGPIYKEEYEELKGTYSMNAIIGKSGLEKTFEEVLRGTDGTMQTLRSASGAILSTTVVEEPVPGNTLVLTIDSYLQQQLNASLENLVETVTNYGNQGYRSQRELGAARGAAAVVIDCKTGGVLACTSYPSYDLALYNTNYYDYLQDELTPLFNRALYGTYRPGSAFKPCTGLAGMLHGVITPDSTVYCGGVYTYFAPTYTPGCLMHGHGRGNINIVRALMASCNSFFYDVGRRSGYEAINSTANALGLGALTGIEIGEAAGSLTSPEYRKAQIEAGLPVEQLQDGDILQASIGQMDTFVSPVQLATYAATLANHGTRYRTHLVGATTTYDYSQITEIPPEVLSQLEDTVGAFDAVEAGMVAASLQGSSSAFLAGYPYTIATKTGTPQVTASTTNGTIIAYGPTENPEIAVAIVVENCANGYWLTQGVVDIFDAYYFSKNGSLAVTPENTLLG